jgi:LEA14-like dessication related protein
MEKGVLSKSAAAVVVLFVVLTLTTCQTLSSALQEPVVSLHSVEFAGISFNGVDLLCKVQVQNPNIFDIPLPEVGWEFFINTFSFINGIIKNDQRIKAQNTTLINVPVSLDFLEVIRTFSSLKGRSSTDYKIALTAKFNFPVLGDKVWNFAHEGELPIPQVPKLSTPSMRIDRADLTRVEILASVNVENPNVFELPPPRIAYDYFVNRNSFIKGTIETPGPLAASSVTPVTFRLIVTYVDLLRTFSNLSSLSEIPSLLNMTFDFAMPVFSGEPFSLQVPGTLPLSGYLR